MFQNFEISCNNGLFVLNYSCKGRKRWKRVNTALELKIFH